MSAIGADLPEIEVLVVDHGTDQAGWVRGPGRGVPGDGSTGTRMPSGAANVAVATPAASSTVVPMRCPAGPLNYLDTEVAGDPISSSSVRTEH